MRYLLYTAVFGVALLLQPAANAQADDFNQYEKKKTFALEDLKKYPRPDTNRINALINVFGLATFLKERQELKPYCDEAFALSRDLQYTRGLAQCYLFYGFLHKSMLDKPRAHVYFDSLIYVTANTKESRLLRLRGRAYEWKGVLYYEEENYYTSINYFFESLKYVDIAGSGDYHRKYFFLTEIYMALNNLEKAEEYAQKNIQIAEKDGGRVPLISAYLPLVDIYLTRRDLRSATAYLDRISSFIPDPKEVQLNFSYYRKRGQLHALLQNTDSAFYYLHQTYKYAVLGGHKNSISAALGQLSAIALQSGNNEAAKTYALQSLALSEETSIKAGKIDALINLANYYYTIHDSPKAVELMRQAIELKDSLIAENNTKQINILSSIYETGRKQKEITQLQTEKEKQAAEVKQKSLLNRVFVGAILLLLLLVYLAYRSFRSRQKIANQQQALQKLKIAELEKDRQILAIDAMLKGQEEERSRIAKDLHDGLGSVLSGTKLSFANIKENLIMNPENAVHFEKSLSMLDNAISDLRKMAHNLMPEALVKFGLNDALRDFCDSIQFSSGLHITYQQFGENRKVDSTAAVFIYRIVQELVNNVIKHAHARRVIVQLTMNPGKIAIVVEDDGKGFYKNGMKHAKGNGIANINYRVQYFNGNLDIVTSPGNGTSVNIELIA